MSKLISIKLLGSLLGISKQGIHNKISRGIIPKECIFSLKIGNRKSVRVDLDFLVEKKPQLKAVIEINKIKAQHNKESTNLIQIGKFAEALGLSVSSVYRHVDNGLYPFTELPSFGDKRKIRILKNETMDKFPQLKRIITDL